MAVSSRIDPLDRDIELIIANDLSPAARSAHLANFAREKLAEAQAGNQVALGRVPPHETIVDQRRGAVVETVKPDGTIVFEFEMIETALAAIGEMLVLQSPVLSGDYQDSHVLLADGIAITPGQPIPAASEYVFVNSQPYARKIERGLSPQAPEGVYHAVAVLASRRFGNLASVKFSYRTLLTPPASRGANRAERKAESAARQPAIIITTR